jgi:hypothetical protein
MWKSRPQESVEPSAGQGTGDGDDHHGDATSVISPRPASAFKFCIVRYVYA